MPPDRDLDRELRDLGPHVDYPPTPDLAGSVRSRLEAEGETAGRPAPAGPNLWWVAAAALVLAVALPGLALLLNTMGNSLAGSVSGGGMAVDEGGQAGGGSGRQGGADPAESTQPPLAMESGASSSAGSGSSAAACFSPNPILEARPARGAPGDEFGIRGRRFDGNPRDCDADRARNVRVEFLQDGKGWKLGRLASDEDSRLIARLEVPADAKPGRATLRATYGRGSPGDPYGQTTTEARFFVLE